MATREARIRTRLFAGLRTFDKERAGFVPLPIILRVAQFLFSPRGFQIYCYILMRAGPEGVAWFPLSEMAWDLDFKSLPKLKPYVDQLIDDGWLVRESSRGRDYYMAPDPIRVIDQLRKAGKVPEDRLEAIDELLELIGRARPADRKAAAGGDAP